ncbi:glycerol dehydratase reactivase beta/small subunit family protein [Citrobacter sp. Cu096]|uniref:glycerol dehydratase reactivase beta/small subunit family protein n=1 Tax=Citrobacter TaxID=544 RepID=UPI002576174D|nr:glycerol dehydratase reactivase beta/small subunit family protein [Citrobacter sp. Cu096]MDM2740398.1 glycerol dehydratase reactivase beta/small subunit family protein [Citrobacter sp. Cu096]
MSLSSPAVHLFYHSRWQDTHVLDELCWGLEEQGVPYRAICCDDHDCALALGQLAAKSSTLRVGLGLNYAGDIALTHAQLPEDRALVCGHICAGAVRIRMLGANAGQLVKVLPFSEIT